MKRLSITATEAKPWDEPLMGLEIAELILAVEDEFGIRVPGDGLGARTVGELYSFLLSELRMVPDTTTEKAYHKLMEALVAELGVDTASVLPSTRLEDLIPSKNRLKRWESLAKRLGWYFPGLVPSRTVAAPKFLFWFPVVVLLSMAVGFLTYVISGILAYEDKEFLAGTAVFVGLPVFVYAYSLLYSTLLPAFLLHSDARFPPGLETVGDAVRDLRASNYHLLCGEAQEQESLSPDREKVWLRLRQIIVVRFRVKPEQVTKDVRFVEDLGWG